MAPLEPLKKEEPPLLGAALGEGVRRVGSGPSAVCCRDDPTSRRIRRAEPLPSHHRLYRAGRPWLSPSWGVSGALKMWVKVVLRLLSASGTWVCFSSGATDSYLRRALRDVRQRASHETRFFARENKALRLSNAGLIGQSPQTPSSHPGTAARATASNRSHRSASSWSNVNGQSAGNPNGGSPCARPASN